MTERGGNIESLTLHRSSKDGKMPAWTPIEMLREMVMLIETGKIKPAGMAVHFHQTVDGTDRTVFMLSAARLTVPMHITMLESAKRWMLDNWLSNP